MKQLRPSEKRFKSPAHSRGGAVGDPLSGQRVFRTLNKLDGNGARTAEEFQYHFDSSGRLTEATFAMSPRTDTGAPTSPPYYTSSHPYLSRGRAHYEYDPGGRLLKLKHWWEEYDQTSQQYLASEPVLGNQRLYDAVKGLCVQSDFYVKSGMNWALERSETYAYDVALDYLTSASYGDGLPNSTITWGYDAAGNRISDSSQAGTWTYDNLNRMTASPGYTYTNDILGNRLTKGSGSYGWDVLNRMVSLNTTHQYVYRADGMRVQKIVSGSGTSYVDSYHDGQMPIEEHAYRNGTTTYSTRNGIGARGIDVVTHTESGQTTSSYPLYDAHGNNVATLTKGSGSTYVVGNRRSYDAWGGVRSGTVNGKQKYVANLGHVEDDESGLTYMRARYYEPGSGRFLSIDQALQGRNWYTYCTNDPINYVDETGMWDSRSEGVNRLVAGLLLMLLGAAHSRSGLFLALVDTIFLLSWHAQVSKDNIPAADAEGRFRGAIGLLLFGTLGAVADMMNRPTGVSVAQQAIGLMMVHVGFISSFLEMTSLEEAYGL